MLLKNPQSGKLEDVLLSDREVLGVAFAETLEQHYEDLKAGVQTRRKECKTAALHYLARNFEKEESLRCKSSNCWVCLSTHNYTAQGLAKYFQKPETLDNIKKDCS